MAVLETLEGDNMEPEILNAGTFGVNMARASLKAWEPSMADVLNRKPRRPALTSGIPAKFRAAAANKGTATRRPVRRLPARGAAGARPWGGSSGRFVMVGDEFDPESLEGWLTDLKKGARKSVRAVGNVGSAIVRPVASVGLNVLRSTAKPVGTLVGTAIGSTFGTTQMGAGTEGMLGNMASMFGIGGSPIAVCAKPASRNSTLNTSSSTVAPSGTPAAMPATGGGIPLIYLIGGGALLLVLLLRK